MAAPVVTVRGEATLTGPPDLVTLAVTVHAGGDTAEQVRSRLAAGSARLAELVVSFADALETSSTTGVHVGPVFTRRAPARVKGYSGTFSTQLVLHDFDALSPVALAVSELPDSQLDGPWWSLRPGNPLYRDARLAAVTNARSRAADYAAAFGAGLGDLVEVTDLEPSYPGRMPRRYVALSGTADDEPAMEFTPEQQNVSGEVTVRFTLRVEPQ